MYAPFEKSGKRLSQGTKTGDAAVGFFLDELADWLLSRHDDRLEIGDTTQSHIMRVASAAADFSSFLAVLEGSHIPAHEWRANIDFAAKASVGVVGAQTNKEKDKATHNG